MILGSVPVYLGDAAQLKSLLPHPKAAIFVADFPNITALTEYLVYLTQNETAFEEHRAWRHDFTYEKNIAGRPAMEIPLHCRICQWAVRTINNSSSYRAPRKVCLPPKENPLPTHTKQKLPPEFENLALRPKNSRQVYLVQHGILHSIPDLPTFMALNMSLESIHVIEPDELHHMIIGESLPSKVEQ